MKLKFTPQEVENHFRELILAHNGQPDKSVLEKFVNDNFTLENQMEEYSPKDWIPHPKLISKIQDLNLSLFAQDLNSRWKTLCRKIKDEVKDQPDRYTVYDFSKTLCFYLLD